MKLSELYSELTVRDQKFNAGLGRARKSLRETTQSLSNFANQGLIVFAAITAAMGGFLKLAADVEEEASMFEAVFKESAGAAEAFAEALAKKANRSIFDIKRSMAGLQDTFVPLGFARDSAREMSQAMVELAVDVASFKNAAEADVIRDFQSAIVGNHETVRKYGIIVTQASLQQELYRMGIKKNITAATEQEKVLARLNIIMEGTSDAHGDAARTSGSFTNQTRALLASLKDLGVELGRAILPLARGFVGLLRGIVPKLVEWVKENAGLIQTVAKVVIGVGIFLVALKALTIAMTIYSAIQSFATAGPVGLIAFAVALGVAAAGAAYMSSKLSDLADDAGIAAEEVKKLVLETGRLQTVTKGEAGRTFDTRAKMEKRRKELSGDSLEFTDPKTGLKRRGGFGGPTREGFGPDPNRKPAKNRQFEPGIQRGEVEGRKGGFVGVQDLIKNVQMAALERAQKAREQKKVQLMEQHKTLLQQIRDKLGNQEFGGALEIV